MVIMSNSIQKCSIDIPDEILDLRTRSRTEIKSEEQKCIFDIPDEILEDNLFTLLSFGDLMNLMNIGNERLYRCCNSVIKKKHMRSLKNEWITSARIGNLEKMKNIYKIIKENLNEEDIKDWRIGSFIILIRVTGILAKEGILRWLLHELKFDVNEKNSYGNTALHLAAFSNQTECARFLLASGSKHLKDRWGNTPLDIAKRDGHKEMQILIESHFQLS